MTSQIAAQAVHDDAENKKMAEELYNLLMAEIEPDLLLENIPGLDEKYKGETKDEHDLRMKRYEVAYKKFDEEFSKFMVEVDDKVRTSKRSALKEKESAAQAEDEARLQSLTSAFQ